MKQVLLMIAVMALVGCGKQEQATTEEPKPTTNTNKVSGTTEKPVKELTPEQKQKALRDSAVGEYELKEFRSARFLKGAVLKQVYLENGVREWYINSTKQGSFKWSIVDGEIHVDNEDKDAPGGTGILRINKDGSITDIAYIIDGERTDFRKEDQYTYKKIK